MLKTVTIRSTLAALACAFSLSAHAMADTARKVEVPAGELTHALRTLAEQAGVEFIYSAEQLKGIHTKGVRGEYTMEKAVRKLLEGTDLKVKAHPSGALLISDARPPTAPAVASDAGTRRIAQVTSAQSDQAGAPRASMEVPRRAEELEELVVKGIPEVLVVGKRSSNVDIQRTEDDAQPYVVFNSETIRQSGAQNLEGFLRDRLTMNSNGLATSQRNTLSGSASRFNLRGLGAGQTLILVNGRRMAPGPATSTSPQQSDINGIPLSAVERIEVLPATASGIYGGSATGGVINIILRNDYDGTEVKVIYGNTFQSDVAERRIDLSTGFNSEDGRTNLLLSGSYSDLNPLTTSERESLLERYYAIARANAPEVLLPPNNPPLGSTANIRSANGSNLVLRDTTPLNSPITHIPLGYAGTSTDGGQALVANDGSYNLGLADGLQHATSTGSQIGAAPRNAAFRAVLRQEFTSRVSAFLETGADQVRAVGPLAYTNGAQISPYRVSAAAPNNPFNTDILVTVPSNSFSYAETPGTETERYRATGGLIVALPGEWRATAEYTWARTRIDYVGSGGFSTGADTAAVLNGTVDVLRDTNIYPVDLMSYLTVEPFSGVQEIGFRNAALRFAGPILELPGGAMTLSTLLEYSNEKFPGTTLDRPGQHIFYPGRSSSAASVYVETVIPLVSAKNRRAGVEALEVQLAARADEYRTLGRTGFVTVGSTTPIVTARNETQSINPTIAIRYEPLEDLVLRTSYGTGFVAPTVAQLASSFNVTPFTIVDPRRGNTSTSLAPGQLVQGGNPNLDPEKSESWSAGIIWSPQFASGLRVSLDYTRIRKTDNIATYPSGLGIINDEAQFPDRVQRGERLPGDPAGWAGPITLLDLSLLNVAGAKAETLDLQLDYALETAIGTFSVSGVATRQMHLESQALASLPIQENVGLSYINPQEYVGNLELKWRHHAWTASWFSRYYDSYFTADPAVASNAAHIRLQGNGGRVPSQSYHDLTVNWASDYSGRDVSGFLTGTEFQLGIRNIFDKTPPFDANIYNTVRTFHSPLGDPLGRTWQAAITKRF